MKASMPAELQDDDLFDEEDDLLSDIEADYLPQLLSAFSALVEGF